MPRDLFAAFRATFEEAADADLLLEVVDAADPEFDEHLRTTAEVLEQLGIDQLPRLVVYNKIDRLPLATRIALAREPGAVAISALDRATTQELVSRLALELAAVTRLERAPGAVVDPPGSGGAVGGAPSPP